MDHVGSMYSDRSSRSRSEKVEVFFIAGLLCIVRLGPAHAFFTYPCTYLVHSFCIFLRV